MLFDDVTKELNPFGRYQKRMYVLISLSGVPIGMHILVNVFLLVTPQHRCAVPGLDNDTWASQGPWHDDMVKMTIPYDQDHGTFDQCSYYAGQPLTNSLEKRTTLHNATAECFRWVYSKVEFQQTVVSELNLVCEKKTKVPLANSILLAGLLSGSLALGTLSDVIGRKRVMIIGLLGQFAVSLTTAFLKNYFAFICLRFLSAFFGIGFFQAVFVIGMELVDPRQRAIIGTLINVFWALGLYFLLLLAYYIRHWQYLQIAVSSCNAFFFGHLFLLPESARWLASKGRLKEASAIVRKAAKVNKADVSEKVLSLQDLQSDGPQEKVWHLFTSPRLLGRCLIIFINWFVNNMVYFGLGLNVGTLTGDLFLNFLYASTAEGLSYVFCLVSLCYLGRRPLYCFTMLLGGAACMLIIVPVLYGGIDEQWMIVTLPMVGKFGISAAFAIIYLYSAELFPTVVRNSGMGMSSLCACFGGIASPYIADLGNYVSGRMGTALPFLVFGGLSVLASLCALFLPETRGQRLPQTVEDAKDFGRIPRLTSVQVLNPRDNPTFEK